jgi:hypothetical protein
MAASHRVMSARSAGSPQTTNHRPWRWPADGACTALFSEPGDGAPAKSPARVPGYAPTDYEIVLDRWTRTDDLVTATEMDNVLSVTATYES